MTIEKESDLREIARMTAQETVNRTFLALGVDVATVPGQIEMQQDFAFVRGARLTARKMRMHLLTIVVGLAASGAAVAIWHAVIAAKATN